MRLVQRLLLGTSLVIAVLVTMLAAMSGARLRHELEALEVEQQTREARLVAAEWTADADPERLARTFGIALGHRVTLIDTAGRVIGDTEFEGEALRALNNHANRPEVIAATHGEVGVSTRTSPSIGDQRLYVAVRAARGVARISIDTRQLDAVVSRTRRDVFASGIAAMITALVLAIAFARTVSRPVEELRDVARALAAGDLSRRPALTAPGELGDLADAVHRMAEQLEARLAALQADDALMAALIDALQEGVAAVDARRQVVILNEPARRLLGITDRVPLPADLLPRDPSLREALTGAFGLTRTRRLEAVRRDFVANVSHELKTPITVIGGFAETLATHDPGEEQRRQFIEAIRGNAKRMQRLVDDLLDLSRIESGGWVPKPERVDLRAVATEIASTFQGPAAERKVSLALAIDARASALTADTTALRQVLTNLVDNALRHTPSGGKVTIFSEPDARGIALGVRDTGAGISAEHLPRIFERFYRVDPARSREAGGTGLGLAIVKHLVEAHRGKVSAESTLGRGTTVRAIFPEAAVTTS